MNHKTKTYAWQGIDRSGTHVSGHSSGQNSALVKALLRGRGIRPTQVNAARRITNLLFLFTEKPQSATQPRSGIYLVCFLPQLKVHFRKSRIGIGVDTSERLSRFHLIALFHKQIEDIGVKRIIISVSYDNAGIGTGERENFGHFAIEYGTDDCLFLCLNINTVAVGRDVPLAVAVYSKLRYNGRGTRNRHGQLAFVGGEVFG